MLNVFLGYACNLACGYCLQAPEEQRGPAAGLSAARIERFVRRTVPWLKDKGIRKIAYWGGEPLIYWKPIVQLHDALLASGLTFDMVKFVTNGTLLDDEHVETLNRWQAYVVVSRHDGVVYPRWDKVARVQTASISYLFHHQELFAWPWLTELDDLEQRHGRPFFPYMHWVRATPGARPAYHLRHADLDAHIPHLWQLARMAADGHRHAQGMWRGHVAQWRTDLRPGEDAPAMCHGDHQIDVDLDGNRYGCHHTVSDDLKLGAVDGPVVNEPAWRQVYKHIDSPECRSCDLCTWCRGNCHLSLTHDVDCRLAKEKHRILAWLVDRGAVDTRSALPMYLHS